MDFTNDLFIKMVLLPCIVFFVLVLLNFIYLFKNRNTEDKKNNNFFIIICIMISSIISANIVYNFSVFDLIMKNDFIVSKTTLIIYLSLNYTSIILWSMVLSKIVSKIVAWKFDKERIIDISRFLPPLENQPSKKSISPRSYNMTFSIYFSALSQAPSIIALSYIINLINKI